MKNKNLRVQDIYCCSVSNMLCTLNKYTQFSKAQHPFVFHFQINWLWKVGLHCNENYTQLSMFQIYAISERVMLQHMLFTILSNFILTKCSGTLPSSHILTISFFAVLKDASRILNQITIK